MILVKDKIRRNVLVSSDHGLMIVNRFDCNHEQVGHGQWLLDHGNTSTIEAQAAYDCLKDRLNPVIFDIGANIGTFTTWMASAFPHGKIYCFEPQRLIFQMLCGNLAINNFDNCWVYNMGLGQQNTRIEIQEPDYYHSEDFGIFSLVEDKVNHKSGVRSMVDLMTLDTFCEINHIDRLDYIKIDAEGMDLAVLKGASSTLQRFMPTIFIEHNDNRRSILEEIVEYLGSDRYNFRVIGNNLLAVPG
jgi:FkbM family methyltransferase